MTHMFGHKACALRRCTRIDLFSHAPYSTICLLLLNWFMNLLDMPSCPFTCRIQFRSPYTTDWLLKEPEIRSFHKPAGLFTKDYDFQR